ncbi:hypothetical protein [Cupriavidus sp. TMH.W2]
MESTSSIKASSLHCRDSCESLPPSARYDHLLRAGLALIAPELPEIQP